MYGKSPRSAETSRCGHAHACDAFPVQTVHLVVDSGELGQPDGAFGVEGMARRQTYDDRHMTLAKAQLG